MKTSLKLLSIVVCGVVAFALLQASADLGDSVVNTKHNLSSSGPGPIRVAGETEVCKFCHTPHASNPIAPLWNRNDPGTYYQTYKSSTLVANVGQPTGSSRLCLSCHDGTIALTQTYNPRNAPTGTIYISPQDAGYIGTDLSDDHPISFVYDSSLVATKGQLVHPSSLPEELPLDHMGRLQCTTCHDAHNDRFGHFLNMDNTGARMCTTCHNLTGWNASAHATSPGSLSSSHRDDWDNINAGTVAQASCEACHRPHSAGGHERLLRFEAEEDNCLSCHDGSVADVNIAAELQKFSSHPVSHTTGVHDPVESPGSMSKHVECADCHNPHRARGTSTANAPYIKGPMIGATGISGAGGQRGEATYEYEVCYRCHAGSGTVRSPLVDRVFINTDVSDEFSPANPSYHPVEAQGRNRDVPSLFQDMRSTDIIYCTDCHGSDRETSPGPHGSSHEPLLVRNYSISENVSESASAYALCYGCHNRSVVLDERRSFPEHERHLDEGAPCSACHDPHGVSASHASATYSGTHLINFDRRVAEASPTTGTGPIFIDQGLRRGSCTLECHGQDHVAETYRP